MNQNQFHMLYDFTDRTVLITGGAGVLGNEIARMLVECNANVAILSRNAERGEKSIAEITVEDHALSGLFIGDHLSAWNEAAELSAECHIKWCEKPFQRVLSCAPPMYDELWTGAKAMYKLEAAVALDGEVVIYAPHLDVVSHVHGKYIYEIGYHILPYFLHDWDRFKNIPLGVLAHSTHLRGSGVMDNGIEKPNVRVTLASKISAEDCARLNLGYLDPARINIKDWRDRENEGILYVPKAGEILYRMK